MNKREEINCYVSKVGFQGGNPAQDDIAKHNKDANTKMQEAVAQGKKVTFHTQVFHPDQPYLYLHTKWMEIWFEEEEPKKETINIPSRDDII